MSKQGYELAPSAPLPTAPPPSYDMATSQPPYNPHMQAMAPQYHNQPAPMMQESLQQASNVSYPVHQYQQHTTQPTGNTVVVGLPVLVGPKSLRTTCPNCHASIQSRTTKENKGTAHLFCIGLFFICCCLCSWIPYCLDSMKVVRHTCPKCKAHLGTYRP